MKKNKVVGKVKWFNDARGFGFITISDNHGTEQDVFVHYSEIQKDGFKTLAQDAKVSLKVEPDSTGKPCARDVEVI